MKRHGVMIVGMVLSACGSLSADNSVQFLVQWNGWMDAGVLQESYELEFNVRVPAQTVEVKFPGASNYIPMEYDDEDQYFDLDPINTEFPTLSQLFAGLGLANGNCFIRIDKGLSTESVYRFSINTAAIIVDGFPGFATNIFPDEGQTVGPDITFTWTNPDGYENFVGPWMGVEQGYNYYDGGMQTPGTTEWTCDPLENGPATFEIGYAKVTDGIAGVMTYVSGKTIVWGLSEYSPTGWAPGKPLTALISDLDVDFVVAVIPTGNIRLGVYHDISLIVGQPNDSYALVVSVDVPNITSAELKLPLSGDYYWMDLPPAGMPGSFALRLRGYPTLADLYASTGLSDGLCYLRIDVGRVTESVYSFSFNRAPIQPSAFLPFPSNVQPPSGSLVELPAVFSWTLPEGYQGKVGLFISNDSGSSGGMLPKGTTSASPDGLQGGWNQVHLFVTKTLDGIAGPLIWSSGAEINWDHTSVAPLGWQKEKPLTYLGSEWNGEYLPINPGECVFVLPGDLNRDCRIDLEDIAIFAQNWLFDCRGTQVSSECWGYLP